MIHHVLVQPPPNNKIKSKVVDLRGIFSSAKSVILVLELLFWVQTAAGADVKGEKITQSCRVPARTAMFRKVTLVRLCEIVFMMYSVEEVNRIMVILIM